jgi:hypothetical protein
MRYILPRYFRLTRLAPALPAVVIAVNACQEDAESPTAPVVPAVPAAPATPAATAVLRFRQISAGRSLYSCGVTADYRAYCWGRNLRGVLGDGTTTQRLRPLRLPAGSPSSR